MFVTAKWHPTVADHRVRVSRRHDDVAVRTENVPERVAAPVIAFGSVSHGREYRPDSNSPQRCHTLRPPCRRRSH